MDRMGVGYRLYPSYNEYNGVDGKGMDNMIGQWIAKKYDELPALSIARRLLFFHDAVAERRSRLVDRKYSRPRNASAGESTYLNGGPDIADYGIV